MTHGSITASDKAPGRREGNARSTRKALIAAGRSAFADVGFGAASLDEIVTEAGVTTGALYHHFGNKKGLFRAVAKSIEQEILDAVVTGLGANSDLSLWVQLERGLALCLELCAEPGVRRVLFSDAPNVIGVREWREIEVQYGFGLLREMFAQLEKAREIRAGSADVSAQLMLGALMEAAQAVALADDRKRVLKVARATLGSFLMSLKRA